jgi:predicted Zn finger-like uncharacterized protein
MIVQCDQCNAKFRLDDAKVKDGGVKVRCSKCKNIFVVKPEALAEEADFDSFLSGLTPPVPGSDNGSLKSASTVNPSAGQEALEPVQESNEGAQNAEEPVTRSHTPEQDDFDLSEFTFNEQSISAEPASSPVRGPELKADGEFTFAELDLGNEHPPGDVQNLPEQGTEPAPSEEFVFKDESAPPSLPEFELDIDGLDVFGEINGAVPSGATPSLTAKEEVIVPVPEEIFISPEATGLNAQQAEDDFFANDSRAFSLEPEPAEFKAAPDVATDKSDSGQPAPFDFGDFDFGEVAAPVKSESAVPKDESWGIEDHGSPAYSRISAPPLPEMDSFDEEPPPLAISSRRRGGALFPVVVTAVSVFLVLALACGGFYIFKEGPSAFNKLGLGFMAKWFGMENKEAGGIALRNTAGIFLNNKEAGEIFAINGEAVNNFGKPRASIQVKATLFGPKGEVLLQKSAYCGNVLSREQLSVLPATKLETAMNNQFGDSLSNLAVQPGKGIPFVVVFTNVPKEVAEFGVEVVGSTVASQ